MTDVPPKPPAVVLGLCAHGLAVARALDACGVAVHGVEQDASLPGCRSRAARLTLVRDINGPGLIEALLDGRRPWSGGPPPVLYPTNDNMVRTLADAWPALEGRYRLSWSERRTAVRSLLEKSAITQRCKETGSACPASIEFDAHGDPAAVAAQLGLPLIAKPARPAACTGTPNPQRAGAARAARR